MVTRDSIRIGSKKVGGPVIVVAEAGVNHNGSLYKALKLVDAAAKAGADAIKFQTFKADHVASTFAPKAAYHKGTGQEKSQLEMLRRFELSREDFFAISKRAQKRGLLFLSTPGDEESADLLDELNVPAFKIGSGDLTNLPLLAYVAGKKRPVILSTGMSYLEEVELAISTIRSQGNDDIVLLHCVSSYPADPADTNLRAMAALAERFSLPVGLSDHTVGCEVCLAAVALGAVLLEKHFTLSRRLTGPDHKSSLEPAQFRSLVEGVRVVEKALGSAVKEPTPSEQELRIVARRSVVASVDIAKGTVIRASMVTSKRPATGIPPSDIGRVIGMQAKRNIEKDEPLTWDMLEPCKGLPDSNAQQAKPRIGPQ